jgi:hypothetical protein
MLIVDLAYTIPQSEVLVLFDESKARRFINRASELQLARLVLQPAFMSADPVVRRLVLQRSRKDIVSSEGFGHVDALVDAYGDSYQQSHKKYPDAKIESYGFYKLLVEASRFGFRSVPRGGRDAGDLAAFYHLAHVVELLSDERWNSSRSVKQVKWKNGKLRTLRRHR